MATNEKPKAYIAIQEQRARILRQKEETLRTVLTSAKDNPKFIKLLIYSLNSLEGFVSPPNREIRINASIIIRLEGVGILHKITITNIKNEDIVTQAGNILWKLISVYDIVDQELAKLFSDKNGHEAVIEILIAKDQGSGSLPYIRILNGLVQIPQLVSKMLDSGLAQTVKAINDLYPNDIDVITMNFDTMKKISNQKAGRDFLIKNGLIDSIIKNITRCAEMKNAKGVLSGLSVLDNLTRNDEGKEAIKKAGGLECLSNVLDKFESNDNVLKMCSKIYSKIATSDDLHQQLELLKKYYESMTKDPNSVKYQDVNKCLVLISNLMIVEEMCKIVCEKDNMTLLQNTFTEVSKIDLAGKDSAFVSLYVVMNKYFMIIFYRIFAWRPEIYDKSTQLGKEGNEFIKKIQGSLKKIFEGVNKIMSEGDKDIVNVFRKYFCSYNDIIQQNYKSIHEIDQDFVDVLLYMLKSIIVDGEKYFDKKFRSNFIASRVLKIASEIATNKNNNDLFAAIESCYNYMNKLFTISEHNETLSNIIDSIYAILNHNTEFYNANIESIIPTISQFMLNKSKYRYPCLVCLKIYKMFLTEEFLTVYMKTPDPNNKPTHAVNYTNCIVSVMTEKFYKSSVLPANAVVKEKEAIRNEYEEEIPLNPAVESDINKLGTELLSKLIDNLAFKQLLKQYKEASDKFTSQTATPEEITKLENLMLTLYSVLDIKDFYTAGAKDILEYTKSNLLKDVQNYEFSKRDKEKMKAKNFNDILNCISNRIRTELNLIYKILQVAIAAEDFDKSAISYEDLITFLSKTTDVENMKGTLDQFTNTIGFILQNEGDMLINKTEIISEKYTNTNILLLRKLVEEEAALIPIISSLIKFAEAKVELCNILVKGGCPRLLLQIMETTPNVETAEYALKLLKIITLSNEENLTMVANQNVLLKLFELRSKYSANESIIKDCDLISNEIMKLPGQEKYAADVLNEAISDFNNNCKGDYANAEIKQKLLNNLEVINAFTTNEKQIKLLTKEFLKNLTDIFDKTLKDDQVSQVNEKLLTNEMAILAKTRNADEIDHNSLVDKLLEIIKKKSNYREIFISSAQLFSSYLKDDKLYADHVASKMTTDFIDTLFDISDNYLDDEKVSKELNNILCYLCLRNEKFANYIKTRGGLVNVIEELKSTATMNDPASQQLKMNSLRMLSSLLVDEESINMFIKANGVELINTIIKNEMAVVGAQEGDYGNLYVTKEVMKLDDDAKFDPKVDDDYFSYCVEIMKNNKVFCDEKMMKNVVLIADKKYPNRSIVKKVAEIYSKDDVALSENDKDVHLLLKVLLNTNTNALYNEELIKSFEKPYEKIIAKLNDPYTKTLSEEVPKTSKDDLLPLTLTYIAMFINVNDKYSEKLKGIISPTLLDLYKKVYDASVAKSEENEGAVDKGVIIALLRLSKFILSNDKSKISTEDISKYIDFSMPHFTPINQQFSAELLNKLSELFNIIGIKHEPNAHSPAYLNYLQNIYLNSFDFYKNIHTKLNEANLDYKAIPSSSKHTFSMIVNDAKIYFQTTQEDNIKSTTLKRLSDGVINIINDLNKAKNIEKEELTKSLTDLYELLSLVLAHPDAKTLTQSEEFANSVFSSMTESKKNGYEDAQSIFPKIISNITKDTENNNNIFEPAIGFIANDLAAEPMKSVDANIESLTNLSKYSVAVKMLLKNTKLFQALRKLYDESTTNYPRRRNIATIYQNVMKNSYNIDTIVSEDPDTFKSLGKKISATDEVIKDDANIDIAEIELDNVVTIMKDANNYKTLTGQKLLTESDISNGINNYKGKDKLKPKLDELQKILNEHKNAQKEQANVKIDEAILANLKKRIEAAFQAHLAEVEKLSQKDAVEEGKPQEKKEEEKEKEGEAKEEGDSSPAKKDIGFMRQMSLMTSTSVLQKSSTVKKSRMSIISQNLFYNPNNFAFMSPISIRINDDISTALDSLLALIRVLYNNNKTSSDTELIKKRQELILEALKLLKMMSICHQNHKPILELGLLSFMERLVSGSIDNFMIYVACLDILKNCTWSENAVLVLLESPLLDYLIDEVLTLYSKPEEILKNDQLKNCFYYDNINFSNVCKTQKGFEMIFKKIGIEKLRNLGVNTGNVDFLTAIMSMLIEYIRNRDTKEEIDEGLINDILVMCYKGLTLPEKSENLFAKTLLLFGIVYSSKIKEKSQKLDIVKRINENWDEYSSEPDFLLYSIFALAKVSIDDNKSSSEVVDLGLFDKILAVVMTTDLNNNLVDNLAYLYRALVINNKDNCKKMCKSEIIDNIIFFIQRYSTKCKPMIRSVPTMNPSIAGAAATATTSDASKTLEKYSVENRILMNLITTLDCLSVDESSLMFLARSQFLNSVLETIDKPNADIEIIKISLHCLGNYFQRETSKYWKHSEIEQLYNVLKALQKQYYANSDVLISINSIAGYILKGFDSKIYTEKYFLLALESINCQDWNLPLVIMTLKIIRDSIIKHQDLKPDIFDVTRQAIYNLLKLYFNNADVQTFGYNCLTEFGRSPTLSYLIVNSDIITIIRETIDNDEFKSNLEQKIRVRKAIFEMLIVLAADEANSKKITIELLEELLNEMIAPGTEYSEDIVNVAKVIYALLHFKCNIEPFVNYHGLETITEIMKKYKDKPALNLVMFKIISAVAFGGEDYRKKLIDMKFVEIVQDLINTPSMNKKVVFEGKILIHLLNMIVGKRSGKEYKQVDMVGITTEKFIKTNVHQFLTKPKLVKIVTPKGKFKDMELKFSQDLLKVSAHITKDHLPPKAKYTIETSQITDVIKGNTGEAFKKTKGVFSRNPKPELCFSIIGNKTTNGIKSINVECENAKDAENYVIYIKLLVEVIKKKENFDIDASITNITANETTTTAAEEKKA